jgi:hypothetical protein
LEWAKRASSKLLNAGIKLSARYPLPPFPVNLEKAGKRLTPPERLFHNGAMLIPSKYSPIFPLPLGERIKVRGKTSERLSTLTPRPRPCEAEGGPTLSRQRERESISTIFMIRECRRSHRKLLRHVAAKNNILDLAYPLNLPGAGQNLRRV